MSIHRATVRWERSTEDFHYAAYSRDHDWEFDGGPSIPASAAPELLGSGDRADPEQALTAALSSCHMLTFLAICANKGIVVDRYEDAAEGELGRNERGRTALIRVVLRPKIVFDGSAPDAETLAGLHERAHRGCFIANSVTTEVVVEAQNRVVPDRVE